MWGNITIYIQSFLSITWNIYNKWILLNPPCELNIFVLQQQQNLERRFGTSKMHLSPLMTLAAFCIKAVGLLLLIRCWLLLIVAPIVGFCSCSMFCCALLCVHSSFAIISMVKKELVALLCLSSGVSWCCVALIHDAMGLSAVCDCGISWSC